MMRYTQGMTEVYVDEDKIVITNKNGNQHVKANVEQIFGMGDFDKIREVKYSEELTRDKRSHNFHSRQYELVSGYIPRRALEDMGKEVEPEDIDESSFPGLKAEDLIKEYFND